MNISGQQEENLVENRRFWSGSVISALEQDEVFVFGANPQARHGAGAAKAAMKFGAVYGQMDSDGKLLSGTITRGLSANKKTYALITKNLSAGFKEECTGIVYEKEGYNSVSKAQISANIDELYECARKHPQKSFLITYQYETWANGAAKKTLNGYTSKEMLELFVKDKQVPENIVFHESYRQQMLYLCAPLRESSNSSDESSDEKFTQKGEVDKGVGYLKEQNVMPGNCGNGNGNGNGNSNSNGGGGVTDGVSNNKIDGQEKYTFFFHLTSKFSNFHPSLIKYKHYTFISNEQFMMFAKAKKFKDEQIANQILEINNDHLASAFICGKINAKQIIADSQKCANWQRLMQDIKKLGRQVKDFDENVWSQSAYKIVKFGAGLKFSQNEDLKSALLETTGTRLCEASRYDRIWGAGLSENDAKRIAPEKWPGKNLLGKILDDLKVEFGSELIKRPKL